MAVDYMAQATTMILWAMGAFIVGTVLVGVSFAFWFLLRYFQYKIKLDIYEKVGGSWLSFGREAKEVINKADPVTGKRRSYLLLRVPFKGQTKIPIPPSTTFIPHGTILTTKKKVNLLFKDRLFAPLPIKEFSDPALSFNSEDLLSVLDSWDADHQENLDTHRAKATFWDKYQQFITIISVLGLTMVFWIVIFVLTNGGTGGGGSQLIS